MTFLKQIRRFIWGPSEPECVEIYRRMRMITQSGWFVVGTREYKCGRTLTQRGKKEMLRQYEKGTCIAA